jgi:DNA-binding CsgD family transcriptional regulator
VRAAWGEPRPLRPKEVRISEDGLARVVAPDRLLERDAELAALSAVLDAGRGGEGRLVVVEGSAGIGKTRLLGAARERALADGVEVLAARGGELEGAFVFGIVRQLFEAALAGATTDARAELLAGAAELSASLFASEPTSTVREGQESSFAMLHGLYWLAANFAQRKPTVLIVDDLHWADESSLRWLVYLAHRLEGLPLVLLVGTRPPEQADIPELVRELVADSAGVVIRPSALGRASAAALVRERLGDDADPEFSAALETGSGGNPLYLVALIDAVSQQGLAPSAEHAPHVLALGPRAVSYGVSTRLARLPADASGLLRAAAILGDRTELSFTAAVAGLDMPAALAAASALVRSDLLRHETPVEFMHPVIRTAVLEEMTAAERLNGHRRAAEVLLADGALPEDSAVHFAQTVPAHDPLVVATLRDAAARSLARGAPQAAVAYLRRALEEPPQAENRVDVLYELGVAELNSNAAEAAEHLRQAVDALADATDRPEVVLAYSHSLIATDRPEKAIAILQATSDQIRDVDRDLHLRLEARLVVGTQFEPAFRQLRTDRLETARAGELESGIGAALVLAQWAHEEERRGVSRERAIDYARRAQALGALAEMDELLFAMNSLYALALAGEVDEASGALTAAIASAQELGHVVNLSVAYLVRGIVRWERGDLLGAEEDLRMGEVLEWPGLEAERAAYLAEVLLERGERDEARHLVERPLAVGTPGFKLHFVQARGRVRLETGRVEQALADFLEVGSITASLGIENPAYAAWRSQAALSLHRLDRRDEARELAQAELELSRRWGAPRTVGVSARALGLVTGGQAAEPLLREAVEVLGRSPARLEHARALIDLGGALRRGNNRSEARRVLRDGVERAQRCGAIALAARGNEELAATGARPRGKLSSGVDDLTASERRVAHMAADGLSNKEIAQALFVTAKTVEQHLGRAYRKLDINSRRHLTAALAGRGEAAASA